MGKHGSDQHYGQTWLVTGGAGYIGSHVVRALADERLNSIVIDSLESGLCSRVPPSVELIVGDVADIQHLMGAADKIDIAGVIHLAAWKNARESWSAPLKYWANNVGTFTALLEWVVDRSIPNVILSSSSSVYGSQARVTEDSPLNPTSPYGATKLACETLLQQVAAAHGVRACSLRYFNVIGCGDFPDARDRGVDNVVPRFVDAILASQALQVYGTQHDTPDGTCVRDYVDVRDVAMAHALVAAAMAEGGEVAPVLNISYGSPRSVREIAQIVASHLPEHELRVEHLPANPADPAEVWAETSTKLRDLGWSAAYGCEDSVRSHVEATTSSPKDNP